MHFRFHRFGWTPRMWFSCGWADSWWGIYIQWMYLEPASDDWRSASRRLESGRYGRAVWSAWG